MLQVRSLSFAVINSSTRLLPAWRQACEDEGKKVKNIPRDGNTRWNSTFDMLEFVAEYRDVYNAFTGDVELNLRDYKLDKQAWKIIDELCLILKRFKDATLYFSCENACLANVVPALDKLDSHLNPTTQRRLHPAIVRALKLGRNKFNRFYANSDRSPAFREAISEYQYHLLFRVRLLIQNHSASSGSQGEIL